MPFPQAPPGARRMVAIRLALVLWEVILVMFSTYDQTELYSGASPISHVEHCVTFRHDRRLLSHLGFVHNWPTSRWSATRKKKKKKKRKPVFIKGKWNYVVFSRARILSFHPVYRIYTFILYIHNQYYIYLYVYVCIIYAFLYYTFIIYITYIYVCVCTCLCVFSHFRQSIYAIMSVPFHSRSIFIWQTTFLSCCVFDFKKSVACWAETFEGLVHPLPASKKRYNLTQEYNFWPSTFSIPFHNQMVFKDLLSPQLSILFCV